MVRGESAINNCVKIKEENGWKKQLGNVGTVVIPLRARSPLMSVHHVNRNASF